MKLPKPECEGGYTEQQIFDILGDRELAFRRWMRGQTMMLCDGRRWDPKGQEYVPSDCGTAHGPVVYRWDLERFLAGKPVID